MKTRLPRLSTRMPLELLDWQQVYTPALYDVMTQRRRAFGAKE